MKIETVNIDNIRPYWRNPRKNHDIAGIKESIQKFDFNSPIVVDKEYVIIVGHGRYQALRELGYTEIECVVKQDLSEKKTKEYRIADNRTSDTSIWDEDLLRQELMDITEAVGFTDTQMDKVREMSEGINKLNISDKDITESYENKAKLFETAQDLVEVTCPHCLAEFKVQRNDILKS